MLTTMDLQPTKGSFGDESNRPVKPHIVEWYNLTWVTWSIQIIWPTAIQ